MSEKKYLNELVCRVLDPVRPHVGGLHAVAQANAANRDAGALAWPRRCYLPIGLATEFLRTVRDGRACGAGHAPPPSPGALATTITWEKTKGIYRFDEEVMASLVKTPLTRSIPVEVLRRLPEWCVFVPHDPANSGEMVGFFAHLDWWEDRGNDYGYGEEMRISFLSRGGRLQEMWLPLIPGSSIEDALTMGLTADLRRGGQVAPAEQLQRIAAAQAKLISPCISLLLYLCSDEPDIKDDSGANRPLMPPDSPRWEQRGRRPPKARKRPVEWGVGYRIGAALRASAEGADRAAPGGGTHASPRAHIRRAHWQGYWTGPRSRPAERRIVMKWKHPCLIGSDAIARPIVERPVPPRRTGS